ncbi:hypothetical protein [Dysgonomonas macrotermitis]|uniref:Uncharacterized protein n=1 Tax=Dysgonomonas macrotermitis TaxID=1346286 RepID=A0A1M5F6D9_9BACT|nr:hypothetical protein [Dysgonomonas macrotermitis]SHF87096.1 hypothetical protein SAMN05444362_11167 [Dysgonomonas macrotermitis]
MKKRRDYTTFDEQRAIRKAQKLIDRINKRPKKLKSVRLDASTIVQIRADHPDADIIIKRIQNIRRNLAPVEQIEYGQYA